MDSIKFLDAVRARHNLSSDNKLAVFLDIDRPRVSLYRTGKRKLDPKACRKVAAALSVPVGYVLAMIQAERAKRTEDRREWEWLAKLAKKSKAAAGLGLAAISGVIVPYFDDLAYAGQCILCKVRRACRHYGRHPQPCAPI